MCDTYKPEKAESDAEKLLRGPMCRKNFGYEVRDQIASRLKRIVDREVAAAFEAERDARRNF